MENEEDKEEDIEEDTKVEDLPTMERLLVSYMTPAGVIFSVLGDVNNIRLRNGHYVSTG